MKCAFEGCERPVKTSGLCRGHYQQKWRGSELKPIKPIASKFEAEESRFWKFVDRKGGDECWTWIGGMAGRRYGMFTFRRKTAAATHVSLRLDGRPRPKGMWALHSCDNPACVNPRHLRWGTAQDNKDDMIGRGRENYTGPKKALRGETNPFSRFTESMIRQMREAHRKGEKQTEIARRFATSQGAVWGIINRRTWQHVP